MIYSGIMLSPYYRNTVFIGNERVALTRKEFDILHFLMLNQGQVLSYNQIYRHIWGHEYEDAAREVLRNSICRLRDKLRICPTGFEYIKTVTDVGYTFSPDI